MTELQIRNKSYLDWSGPVGANPGPHPSLQWPEPLQFKRLMLEQAGEQHTSRLTVIPRRTEAEKQWDLPGEQSAAAEMARESMRERTTKAVVHISMDCRACSEHCVTEYTGIRSITVQSAVSKPIRGKKTLDVELSIHLMGYGKAGGESASIVFYIWVVCVCMCVPQLVICAALSTSAGIDPASSLCWPWGHQRTNKHIFIYFDSCQDHHRQDLFVALECNHYGHMPRCTLTQTLVWFWL